MEKVEKFGTWNRIKASHSNRQVGNGAKRPRPQVTQPSAWRATNKLKCKVEQKQTSLVEEIPYVSRKNQAKANTSSSSVGANGTSIANRPMPL